jgi:hypothetical protein
MQLTLAGSKKHFPVRCQFCNGTQPCVDFVDIGRRLQDIGSQKTRAHRSKCFIQEAEKALLQLGVLKILDQFQRVDSRDIKHNGSL